MWLDEIPETRIAVYEEQAKSILSPNDSPDVPFQYSVNPYRGCQHACSYCYARPFHNYLDWGAGTDFETNLVVKTNAARQLQHAFMAPSWVGDTVAFSGVTDCYQPLEASFGITRACLAVCLRFRNPVGIITKGSLIERDLDLLVSLHEQAAVRVFVSLPFLDMGLARAMEPGAPSPTRRLRTIARLAAAGIPVGVALAPVVPGLNDEQIPAILAAAAEAGANRAFLIPLRLPDGVQEQFYASLRMVAPDRLPRVQAALSEMRGGGDLRGGGVGQRMRGQGVRWQTVVDLFHSCARRLGYQDTKEMGGVGAKQDTFRRPGGTQQTLPFS